jgi:predicted hotdog family 3-hydroxylacyl-ACP dehydratase
MPTDLGLRAEDLLPQKGAMCLLDRVLAADAEHLIATAVFSAASLFCRDGRVGSWVSLECMAQAVGAWAGYQGRLRGVPPRIGFLLGTPRFDCRRAHLALDRELRIEVTKEIQVDEGLGQFSGRTFDGQELIATAVITVFSPEDPSVVIRGAAHA